MSSNAFQRLAREYAEREERLDEIRAQLRAEKAAREAAELKPVCICRHNTIEEQRAGLCAFCGKEIA